MSEYNKGSLEPEGFDLVSFLMAYEAGELDAPDTLKLFSHLIKTGLAWSLQGAYGRAARSLIEHGALDRDGTILNEEG